MDGGWWTSPLVDHRRAGAPGNTVWGFDGGHHRRSEDGEDILWGMFRQSVTEGAGSGAMYQGGGVHFRGSGKLHYEWNLQLATDFSPDLGYFYDQNSVGGNVSCGLWNHFDKGRVEFRGWNAFAQYLPFLHEGGMLRDRLSSEYFLKFRSGYFLSGGVGVGREYNQDSSDAGFHFGWNDNDMYRRGGVSVTKGRRAGGDYTWYQVDQGLYPRKHLAVKVGVEYSHLAPPSPDAYHAYQGVLTASYDVTPEKSVSARLVARDGGVSAYAAYRQVVRRGTDVYIILGDPDPDRTGLATRVAIKMVRVLGEAGAVIPPVPEQSLPSRRNRRRQGRWRRQRMLAHHLPLRPAMNSRERMLAAINRQPVDRLPTDIWATAEVWQKLRAHFGEEVDLKQALHLDGFAGVGAEYTGPTLPEAAEGKSVDFWGMRHREVDYGTGTYWEQCFFPLASARTVDDLERYPWPSPDWFDYSGLKAAAQAQRGTHLVKCGYMAIFYYHNLLRGLEQSLVDPYDDPEFTHHLLGRISDFFYAHHRRIFEACDGLIDVSEITDDLGSQTGPLIGLSTFREFYKPHMVRFAALCREFGARIFHHDDGAMRAFLPDLLEVGIDILNPVQHVCPGMDMAALKRDYGDRLCFHGAIDNQQLLPFGTEDQVRAAVREAIDALASDGTGYIVAPCHNLQTVTPVANILAMYDEAWRYGVR